MKNNYEKSTDNINFDDTPFDKIIDDIMDNAKDQDKMRELLLALSLETKAHRITKGEKV